MIQIGSIRDTTTCNHFFLQFANVFVCTFRKVSYLCSDNQKVNDMETKNITVRIPEKMYKEMQQNSENPRMDVGSINQQIVQGLEKLDTIERLSMNELRRRFTPQEWACMVDMLNGTCVDGQFRYSTDVIIVEIEDSCLYEGVCDKWKVDQKKLIEKCKQLTAAQLDALYRRVDSFWINSSTDTDILKWGEF